MKKAIFKFVLLTFFIHSNTSFSGANTLYIYTNLQTPDLAEESISLLQCLSNNAQIQWDLIMSKNNEYLPRLELDEINEKNILATLISTEGSVEKIKIEKNNLSKELCAKILQNKKINTENSTQISLQPQNDILKDSNLNESYANIEDTQKSILPWVLGGALLLIGGIFLAKKLSTPNGGNTTIVTQ